MKIRRFLPVALAAVLLVSAGWHMQANLRSFNPAAVSANDATTFWDEHMRLVAAALPSDVAVVGYLESADLDPSVREREQAEFYLTQYGLAPRIVQVGANYDWIVGDFRIARPPRELRRALEQKLGPYSSQGFGSRIYLIHRISP